MEGDEPKVEAITPKEEVTETKVDTTKEIEALLVKIKEMDESYKGLQRTLNKKDEELKKNADLRGELDSLKETFKVVVGELAEKGNISEDLETIPKEKKINLLSKFDDIQKQQEQKRQLEDFKSKVNEYQEKVNQLGLSHEELEYIDIKDAVISGKFDRADALIRKVEKSKMPEKKEEAKQKVETPEEMSKRIRSEILKEYKLEKLEDGQPSGASTNDEAIRKAYRENPNDRKAYNDYMAYIKRKQGR